MCNYPNAKVTIPDDWQVTTYEKIMSATSSGKCFRDPWERGVKAGEFTDNKRTEVLYFRGRKGELSEALKKLFKHKGMSVFK
jgi:hypothetical protein